MSATALLCAVAVSASGCGIGEAGPRPGVAAEVDGTVLSTSDLNTLVDAVCVITAATPDSAATSRGAAQASLLQSWVGSTVVNAFGDEQGIDGKAPEPDTGSIAGWDQLDSDQQSVVSDYLTRIGSAQAIASASGGSPDPDDFDVVINPRFGLAIEDGQFVDEDGQLSVAVSDAAKDAATSTSGQLSADEVAALPDSQLCGARPEAVATPEG
ncbi:hypothetical protein E8D34_10605 [Nocardioides sp. GY 10113]|uniref:hypothetical protein n=1 Tax=Nocardioides sp. GY 10113 TaxID=2569761 RepID=UPI0010A94848|nr:hypothetical protein [Nocardioides sp. GY 10113]TIC87555.1 hypothetical protein E8D34_10605 [Nocardioides sp. GY 10113]